MSCPLCGRRKARRACPALHRQICAVCCGTKRLIEIQCPPDCGYLVSSRSHPPATVLKQQERDMRFVLPTMQALSPAQLEIAFMVHETIERTRPGTFPGLTDHDVAEATGAIAATFETAERGVIYEHRPASAPAERLVTAIKERLDAAGRDRGRRFERDAALALRAVERGATSAHASLEGGGQAYLALIERLTRYAMRAPETAAPAETPEPRIIIP